MFGDIEREKSPAMYILLNKWRDFAGSTIHVFVTSQGMS